MSYEEIEAYLYSLRFLDATHGISRMRSLMQCLGHPEKKFPIIHVAGTNGKGSTCAMLEAIYRKAGYRVGLFTSPHLVHLGERIQVNRKMISEQEIIDTTQELTGVAKTLSEHPSFFEFINAMAFVHFEKCAVDIAIVETGLGGEWDSTNIVDPLASVITSIGWDHMAILGDDLGSIAQAKAGIIKSKRPVVMGSVPDEAEAVIRVIAEKRKAPVYTIDPIEDYPEVSLQGSTQRKNAALALSVCAILSKHFPVSRSTAEGALTTVYWPGRWQEIQFEGRKLILDATHNLDATSTFQENLESLISQDKEKPTILVGILGDYRSKILMPIIAEYAKAILLLRPNQPRSSTFEALKAAIPQSFQGSTLCTSVKATFSKTKAHLLGKYEGTLVATGSLYLIGEIMKELKVQL